MKVAFTLKFIWKVVNRLQSQALSGKPIKTVILGAKVFSIG